MPQKNNLKILQVAIFDSVLLNGAVKCWDYILKVPVWSTGKL